VFEHLDPAVSAEVLEEFDVKTAVYTVENMSIERAVDVLQHAELSFTHAILQRLSSSIRQQVKDYIAYDPESVGGIMRVRAPVVNIDVTVEATLDASRAYDSDWPNVKSLERR
jgi:Mg/Co/Ni transporter MgtE (contains CBS domain)